ncbi:MAG: helix-turn-helix domain-containing protein [Sphingobacterium sp.]|jgi:AraC-like DNA-binding protein|nr:helix-turn-helix domain-containing protein [Sphingobacterium sp.]
MNFYIVSLLDAMAEQNLSIFCDLNFVKSAGLFSDLHEISKRFKIITDFYFSFLKKLDYLPSRAVISDHFGYYDFTDVNGYNRAVNEVFRNLNHKGIVFKDVLPVQVRYTDKDNMHLVVGLCRIENIKKSFLHIVDLSLPKDGIKNIPSEVTYVKEILDEYVHHEKQTLRAFIEEKGFNYNLFQRHCKICFGDSFYSFWLKAKMIEAVEDIVFTTMSLKQVAFKNKFLDYQNMYKAFIRHGVGLTTIPRLANL